VTTYRQILPRETNAVHHKFSPRPMKQPCHTHSQAHNTQAHVCAVLTQQISTVTRNSTKTHLSRQRHNFTPTAKISPPIPATL